MLTAADSDDTAPNQTDFDGQSSACPGVSCLGLLDAGDSVGDGTYWIDPSGTETFPAICDMTTEGGGYTYFAVDSGQSTSTVNDANSCPAGTNIVFPRSRDHWVSMLARFDSSYFATTPGVYKTGGGGNYSGCAMNSNGCSDWRVLDGGRWWLRATPYGEPSGDYTGNCWLSMSHWDVDNLHFNDNGCAYATSRYVCSTNDKP